jgi:hypothetical protein
MPTLPYNTQDLLAKSAAMLAQTSAEGDKPFAGSSYDVTAKPKEITTISSDTINKDVIPKNQAILNDYTKSGTYPDQAGFLRYSDNPAELVPAPIGATPTESGGWEYGGQTYGKGPQYYIGDDPDSKAANDLTNLSLQNVDAQTRLQLRSIQSQYNNLKIQQEQINASQQGGAEQSVLLGGGARYSPVASGGFTATVASFGLQQIANLQAQEDQLIATAKQAQAANNQKILDKTLENLQTIREKKVAEATKTSEALRLENEKLQASQVAMQIDNTILDIYSKGTTDPIEIMQTMRELGLPVDSKTVSDTLKNVATNVGIGVDKLTGDAKNYAILKDMPGMLPSNVKSLGDYLKWNRNLTTSKAAGTVGSGDSNITSDQFTKEQIALSVVPTQLINSDRELTRYLEGIRLGLKEGKTPYQIADEMMGYNITEPNEFTASMRQYIALANLGKAEIGNVARLINSKNYAGAIAVIENKVLQSQKQNDPESFVGEATPRYYAEKVEEIKKTIQDAGLLDAIGPVEGSIATIFNKVPLTRRAEALKVQAKVTSLVAEMRNHLAGTAVTESEKKFLEPLVSSLTDKKGIFINKLDEISGNALTRYNNTRAAGGLPELNTNQLLDKAKRISLYGSGPTSTNNSIDNEQAAKDSIINYGKANPADQEMIKGLLSDPNYTFEEVKQILNIK